ncbi:MAG TPA: tetratricopeptide repeat protein [Frankiaceae bacterium]|jgi:tetratricopeptide (TPR) repeat protein|nr:tetratricopeptide repeat protein [Frankiaceae bacterium]
MAWRLAIDFGTSTTAAAVMDDGEPVRLLNLDPHVGDGPMASAIAVQPDGSWLVGTAAVRSAALLADAFEPTPKRRLGERVVRLGGRDYAPSDLVAVILGEVLFEAYRQHGGSAPASVIITHPARWRVGRLTILRDAYGKAITSLPRRFANAELDGSATAHEAPAPTFLAEPVAAARCLLEQEAPVSGPALVAVYDLGAGTFDTSVVRRDVGGQFDVLADGGVVDLGGVLFDEKLFAFIGQTRIQEEDPPAWERLRNPGEDQTWLRRARSLQEEARYAKERLSTHTSAHCAVPELDHLAPVLINRGDFEHLIRDDLMGAAHEFARTVAAAGVTPADLAGVHLVGGSARIPLAASTLLGELSIAATTGAGDPRETVVRGALVLPAASPLPELPQRKSFHAVLEGRLWNAEQRSAGACVTIAVTDDTLFVSEGPSVQRHRLSTLTASNASSLASEDMVAIVGGYQQLGGHLLELRQTAGEPVLTLWCPDDSPSRRSIAHTRAAFERARISRLIAKRTRKHGPGHSETLAARFELARSLGELGNHDEAAALLTQLVADGTRFSGAAQPDTLTTRTLLAYHLDRSGNLAGSADEYARVLTDQVRVLGADHPQTLIARNNRGLVLIRLAKAQEALDEYAALVADHTRISGADHAETLTARSNYAYALGELERFQEAVDAYTVLVADHSRVSGHDHPHTFTARANRAALLARLGEREQAREEYVALIADRTRVWGVDQPDTIATRRALAQLLWAMGRPQEAVDSFSQLAADSTRIFGADSPSTLAIRLLRARALLDRRRDSEALLELTDLVGTFTRGSGAQHPDTLHARILRADALGELSRVQEAVDELADVVAVQSQLLGERHRSTLTAKTYLNERLIQLDAAQAATDLATLIGEATEHLGADSPTTLQARRLHARALTLIGRYEEAAAELTAVIARRTAVLGAEHVGTLMARGELSWCLGVSGRAGEAFELDTVLLEDRRKALGRDHPDTLETQARLAGWSLQLGQSTPAADRYAALIADCTRVFGSGHARTGAAKLGLAAARTAANSTESRDG